MSSAPDTTLGPRVFEADYFSNNNTDNVVQALVLSFSYGLRSSILDSIMPPIYENLECVGIGPTFIVGAQSQNPVGTQNCMSSSLPINPIKYVLKSKTWEHFNKVEGCSRGA
jgi:hypothetical protein